MFTGGNTVRDAPATPLPSNAVMAFAKQFFTGSFSREFLVKRLVPCMYAFLFGCMLVADLLFPPGSNGEPGYVPFTRTISGQGNRADNPLGAWFFTIGLVGTATCLVAFAMHAWRRLVVPCKHTANIALFFSIAGAAGFAMVGIWDEQATCLAMDGSGTCLVYSNVVHTIGSAIAFGGILLSILLHLFPMLKHRAVTGKDAFGAWWQLGHVIGFVLFFAIAAFVQNIPGIIPFFKRYAFWQWSLFLLIAIYYLSLTIRLPRDVPAPSKARHDPSTA